MKTPISLIFRLFVLISLYAGSLFAQSGSVQSIRYFLIGTYTDKGSDGIYRAGLDMNSGKLTDPVLAAKSNDPSFLALTKDERYLLAVNETMDEKGNKMGYIESFAVSNNKAKLFSLNKVLSGGAHPCYVSVNAGGFVLSANYTGGSVALFKLNEKGQISQPLDVQQHHGGGPNKERQEGPHVHSAYFEPVSDRIFVADLGTDVVSVYRLDKSKPQLVPASFPEIKLNQGSGPRHMAFHPNQKFLYVANELSSTVSAVSLNKDGSYTVIETISTIPADFKKPNYPADIHITRDGRFLYLSNRGLNTIATFSVDQKSGKLSLIAQESVKGENPRNFTISPDEKYLLVANQNTENIVSFKLDPNTGKLAYIDQVKAHTPVCLLFQK